MSDKKFDDKMLREFGWNNRCDINKCDRYEKRPHSHNFFYGKEITIICEKCKAVLEPHSQIRDYELGRNRVVIFNAYNCNCPYHFAAEVVLYDGVPAQPAECMKEVKRKVEEIIFQLN